MATALLLMAKVGDETTGGSWPAKRDPSKGSSPSRIGFFLVTSLPWKPAMVSIMAWAWATRIVPMHCIVFSPNRSRQSLPSALSMISMVVGSFRAARNSGPISRSSFLFARSLMVFTASWVMVSVMILVGESGYKFDISKVIFRKKNITTVNPGIVMF